MTMKTIKHESIKCVNVYYVRECYYSWMSREQLGRRTAIVVVVGAHNTTESFLSPVRFSKKKFSKAFVGFTESRRRRRRSFIINSLSGKSERSGRQWRSGSGERRWWFFSSRVTRRLDRRGLRTPRVSPSTRVTAIATRRQTVKSWAADRRKTRFLLASPRRNAHVRSSAARQTRLYVVDRRPSVRFFFLKKSLRTEKSSSSPGPVHWNRPRNRHVRAQRNDSRGRRRRSRRRRTATEKDGDGDVRDGDGRDGNAKDSVPGRRTLYYIQCDFTGRRGGGDL